MSIYSGFPTRKDESNYNILLSRLLTLMQEHILELCSNQIPDKKSMAYRRVLAKMKQYEEHKYLPPKFSELLEPIYSICEVKALAEQVNTNISNISSIHQVQTTKHAQAPSEGKLSSHSLKKILREPMQKLARIERIPSSMNKNQQKVMDYIRFKEQDTDSRQGESKNSKVGKIDKFFDEKLSKDRLPSQKHNMPEERGNLRYTSTMILNEPARLHDLKRKYQTEHE